MSLPLRVGDRGREVADLRRRLCQWQELESLPLLSPGWDFDEETAAVVRMFQRRRLLPADAVVGPETWNALVEATRVMGDRMLWHSATVMRGDDVEDLQQRLNQLGFNAGPEDGLFGPLTGLAVKEFQSNVGLEVDGIVGDHTLRALQAMHRGHHVPGVSSRVREQHDLRRLARAGLTGLQIMIDPASTGEVGDPADAITWALASRFAAVLGSHGARPLLSRGPHSRPSPTERAQMANRLDVDMVVVLALNRNDSPAARGAAAYHYGSLRFVSAVGAALAEALLDATLEAGLGPDCRVHPMTWTILRETRMPVAVLEPGFVTSHEDVAALSDPAIQQRLAATLTQTLGRFLAEHGGD